MCASALLGVLAAGPLTRRGDTRWAPARPAIKVVVAPADHRVGDTDAPDRVHR